MAKEEEKKDLLQLLAYCRGCERPKTNVLFPCHLSLFPVIKQKTKIGLTTRYNNTKKMKVIIIRVTQKTFEHE